jgi:hypothetical protein
MRARCHINNQNAFKSKIPLSKSPLYDFACADSFTLKKLGGDGLMEQKRTISP